MLMFRKSMCFLGVILFALSFICFASCTHRVVDDEAGEVDVVAEEEEMQGVKGEGITEEELDAARRKVAELICAFFVCT